MRLAWELGKTRQEILALPAEEFFYWKAFFEIYAWTYEREEWNAARQAAFTFNSSLRAKQRISVRELLPQYMKHKPVQFVPKSREQQRAEFGMFKAKLKALKEQREPKTI